MYISPVLKTGSECVFIKNKSLEKPKPLTPIPSYPHTIEIVSSFHYDIFTFTDTRHLTTLYN